jgi:hypothetical protein
MYKMVIDLSGEERVYLFRGPGCRKAMLKWWSDHLDRAVTEDIISVRVWGTVGNKTDIVREWFRQAAAAGRRARRTGGRSGSRWGLWQPAHRPS